MFAHLVRVGAVAALLGLNTQRAHAGWNVQECQSDGTYIQQTAKQMLLGGVYEGLLLADSMYLYEKAHGAFCLPATVSMTRDQLASIVNQYIATYQVDAHEPVAMVLIFSLKKTFPCTDKPS